MWQSISVNCLQPLSMCFIACENGTYGEKCLSNCGNCRHGSSCSNVNGSCTDGCEPGFIEALCKTRELFNFQRLNHYSIHTINTSLGVSTYSKLCFFFTHIESSLLPVKGSKCWPVLGNYVQWIWPLWYGTSVDMVIFQDPWHSENFYQWSCLL